MGRNKPRSSVKQNGNRRLKICKGCGHLNCDPMYSYPITRYVQKMMYRKEHNLCIACGHNPCTCKNTNRT